MPKKSPATTQPIELQPENQYCESPSCVSVSDPDEAEWLVEFGSIDFPVKHFAYSCSECLVDTIALALQIHANEIEPSPYEPYSVRVAAYTPGQPILPRPILAEPEVETPSELP